MLWMPSIKLKWDQTVPSDTFTAILKMLINVSHNKVNKRKKDRPRNVVDQFSSKYPRTRTLSVPLDRYINSFDASNWFVN